MSGIRDCGYAPSFTPPSPTSYEPSFQSALATKHYSNFILSKRNAKKKAATYVVHLAGIKPRSNHIAANMVRDEVGRQPLDHVIDSRLATHIRKSSHRLPMKSSNRARSDELTFDSLGLGNRFVGLITLIKEIEECYHGVEHSRVVYGKGLRELLLGWLEKMGLDLGDS